MPETSVVVRAHNEEKHLGGLLKAIRAQNYQDAEIILVDSGSTDRTREIAAEYCDRIIQIASRDFTYGYSLNIGCRASQGQYVVIVSAHTAPLDNDWLGNLVANFKDTRIAMVCGRQLGAPESKLGEVRDLAETFGTEHRLFGPPVYFANNANSAVRRELWEAHPFDETLPGLEDVAWEKHWTDKGYLAAYEPKAGIYHIHEESWAQVRTRYYREAVASKRIGFKGRAKIPSELLREGRRLLKDLGSVVVHPGLWTRTGEVVLFRVSKSIGTVAGLWERTTAPSIEAEEPPRPLNGRAVVIEGPECAVLSEVDVPRLKPGDVLIRVGAVGVCATDLEVYEGTLGYYRHGRADYPIIPGHEFAGWVDFAGTRVEHVREGDRVVVETVQSCGDCPECRSGKREACEYRREVGVLNQSGAYADYVAVPGVYVHPLPPHTDLRMGALCEPLSVVLKGLRRVAGALAGPADVAVIGAGPIGHLATRVLAHRGHAVTVFDRDEKRLGRLADVAAGLRTGIEQLGSFNVVVEATGSGEALSAVLRECRTGVHLLLLGLPYAGSEFEAEQVVAYDKAIIGSVGAGPEDLDEAIGLIHSLRLDPLLGVGYPLESFEQAWDDVRQRRSLKVFIDVNATDGPQRSGSLLGRRTPGVKDSAGRLGGSSPGMDSRR